MPPPFTRQHKPAYLTEVQTLPTLAASFATYSTADADALLHLMTEDYMRNLVVNGNSKGGTFFVGDIWP